MNILVIEDEQLAADKMIGYVEQLYPTAVISGPVKSIKEGFEWFSQHPAPDAVISDIMLTDGLSFEIFKEMGVKCPVIFTTAYDQYAIRAFEVNSIDYLLKPVNIDKLRQSLQKIVVNKPKETSQAFDFDQLAQFLQSNAKNYKTRFLVKVGQKIKAIPTSKIAYFFTQDKLSFVVSHQKEKFPVDHSLEDIDAMLNPNDFFRINRKFIVHIDAVKEIHPYFKGRLKLELLPAVEEDIVISSEKTPSFKAWLDQ